MIGMLQKWEFSIDLYKSIFQYMDANEDVEPSDAAEWFLNNNKIWGEMGDAGSRCGRERRAGVWSLSRHGPTPGAAQVGEKAKPRWGLARPACPRCLRVGRPRRGRQCPHSW